MFQVEQIYVLDISEQIKDYPVINALTLHHLVMLYNFYLNCLILLLFCNVNKHFRVNSAFLD